MSNVIDFLERMGQDATLRYADNREVEMALMQMKITPEHQATVLRREQTQLEVLLGAQANICCTIEPVDVHDGDAERDNLTFQRNDSHRATAAAIQ